MTGGATTYLSFERQALHYFQREHEEIPRAPIDGAAAWRGCELTDEAAWSWRPSWVMPDPGARQ